jgi:hypothetical protein
MSEHVCERMGRVLSEGWHLNASTPSKNSDAADHNNRATKHHASAESEKSPTARDLDSSGQPDRDAESTGSATGGYSHSGQPDTDAKHPREEEEKLRLKHSHKTVSAETGTCLEGFEPPTF